MLQHLNSERSYQKVHMYSLIWAWSEPVLASHYMLVPIASTSSNGSDVPVQLIVLPEP